MKKWLKTIKNEKGLTLIELLAVVVILGIIAAIAIPSISGIIDNSKKDAHVSNALMIISTAKLAVASNDPITSDMTTGVTIEDLIKANFLDAMPKDPDSDQPYTGGTVKIDSDGEYIISLTSGETKGRSITDVKESALTTHGRAIFDKSTETETPSEG